MFLRHKITSYAEMCFRALGKPGYFLANVMIFCFNWGGFCLSLIILGTALPDLMRGLIGYHPIFERRWMLLIAVVALMPFSFYKSIGRFAWISLANCIPNIVLCFLIIVKFFASGYDQDVGTRAQAATQASGGGTSVLSFALPQAFQAIGGISYLFTCNDMFGHVMHSLENPTPKRVRHVIFATMGVFFVLGTSVGVCGYLMFFQNVDDNVVDNFSNTSGFGTACRLMIILAITISAPYSVFMPRVAIMALIQLKWPALVIKGQAPRLHRNILHATLTIVLLGLALMVVELVTNLGAMFGLIGALSAVSISLILPPVCYLRLEKPGLSMRLQLYAIICTGIVGAVGCIVQLAQNWSSS